jgi:hypothetical protein
MIWRWYFGLVLVCTVAFADDAQTFVTIKGDRFEQAHVTTVTPATITIVHSAGVATLPLSEFPAEIQKRYGYDAAKAKVWLEQVTLEEKLRRDREEAERAAAAKREWNAQYEARRRHAEGIEESIWIGQHASDFPTVYDPATHKFYRSQEEAARDREAWLKFLKGAGPYPQ